MRGLHVYGSLIETITVLLVSGSNALYTVRLGTVFYELLYTLLACVHCLETFSRNHFLLSLARN